MSERTTLIVSNDWHKPGITMRVVAPTAELPQGGVRLEMDLEDFKAILLKQLPHPTRLWTRGAVEAAVTAAFEAAVQSIKHSTKGQM